MFDWQVECEGHTRVAFLLFLPSYRLFLFFIFYSLILARMWACVVCDPVCFTRIEAEKNPPQIQSRKAASNTNTHSPCRTLPLSSFCAPSSNTVHCYGLSVLLQVLLTYLLLLLCFSFLPKKKGSKSNWWWKAAGDPLSSSALRALAALGNCLFPCSHCNVKGPMRA